MGSEDVCKHELAIGTCDYCKPKPEKDTVTFAAELRKLVPRPTTSAAFETACAECGFDILPGDPIVKDGTDWLHKECTDG